MASWNTNKMTIDKTKVQWDEEKIDPNAVEWDGAKKEKPVTMKDLGRETLLSGVQGMFRGGPLLGIFDQAGKGAQSVMDRLAYNVGGRATDLAAGSVPAPVAGGIGLAANVATQMVPSMIGGEMAKVIAAPTMQNWSKSLMQSALKPTLADLKTKRADRAVQTLLDEGISPNRAGVQELDKRITALNDQIKQIISSSNATVNKGQVGLRLQETFDDFMKQVNPTADVETIKKAWLEFRNHPMLAGRTDIPVKLAQEIKQGTYKQLSKKYGQMGSADVEAQKAIARGLREEIAGAVPEVASLNKRESELINALKVAERRAYMSGNRNVAGLALLANNPGAALGFMADRSDAVKSLLGRAMYQGSEQIPATTARLGVGLLGSQEGLPEDVSPLWFIQRNR